MVYWSSKCEGMACCTSGEGVVHDAYVARHGEGVVHGAMRVVLECGKCGTAVTMVVL